MPSSLSIPVPRSPADDAGCPPVAHPALPAGALSLFLQARTCLHEAEQAPRPCERYASAHLAAQRAATAVVAARSGPRDSTRPASVWRLLTRVAPELRQWAEFFAAGSDRRAVAEAGIPSIARREADELLGFAGEFVSVVGRSLPGVVR